MPKAMMHCSVFPSVVPKAFYAHVKQGKPIDISVSSIVLLIGLPAPCPASTSMRIRVGFGPVCLSELS